MIIFVEKYRILLHRIFQLRLAELLRRTDARVCLSTTWRSAPELLAELWSALVEAGAAADIFVATTPRISYSQRAREVQKWVDARRAEGWAGDWVAHQSC